jgi:hypothetical protein
MKEIRTEIDIDAPPEVVWRILTDFDSYGDWNPFILSIRGDARKGATLTVRIEPPGGRAMTFKPKVVTFEPERELRWLGHLVIPGLVDGEHTLRVDPLDGERSRFVQSETFTGIFAALAGKTLTRAETGFEQMNAALKERAEGLLR